MNITAAIHRSAEPQLLPRQRRRHRVGPPKPVTTAAAGVNAELLQQLQAAGITIDSLVAVRAPTGEWLLLRAQDHAGQHRTSPIVQDTAEDDHDAGEAFAKAVRTALDDFHLTHRLQANPLLECEVITTRGPSAAAKLNALRDWLRSTNERLSANPATARAARILHRSYFEPARSQQLAAEALGMGYSTYRRLLAEARELLIAELRLG
ncbi:hypothetical protein [Nevskia sp.]|uniref:hypothetical protein n=1 Tax=Nevskia sp. TaxID=1929292 RepID=UPI0025ED31EF|nr:hypothetical protein [Nevskia sp.]